MTTRTSTSCAPSRCYVGGRWFSGPRVAAPADAAQVMSPSVAVTPVLAVAPSDPPS